VVKSFFTFLSSRLNFKYFWIVFITAIFLGELLVIIPVKYQLSKKRFKKTLLTHKENLNEAGLNSSSANRFLPDNNTKEILEELQIEYIDMLPLLEKDLSETNKQFYYDRDAHMTREGHSVIAKAIIDYWSGSNTSFEYAVPQ